MARILTLDGGGIRGLLTARILQRLEAMVPGWLDSVDVIAGASTGGIIALALAAGVPLSDIVALYQDRAKDIFKSRDWLDGIMPDEMWRADFSPKDIQGVLEDVLGATTLGDLNKIVLIPAFDTRTWAPKFYDNWPGHVTDLSMRAVDVAMCTSAAPTYWPTHLWQVDGGVFANNPADCAIAKVFDEQRKAGQPLNGTCCLSIGTGQNNHMARKDPNWDAGIKDMIPMLLNIVFDGALKASSFRARAMLGDKFCRVQPQLPVVLGLADIDCIPTLLSIADMVDLEEAVDWLAVNWSD